MIKLKKIIWVFGESATGKLTFINKLYNGDERTLDYFNMLNKIIEICNVTLEDREKDTYNEIYIDNNEYDDSMMENDNLYFNRQRAIHRRSFILRDVKNFINGDNDVLLIKGQVNDLNYKRGDIVNNFLCRYSNIKNLKIEVIILQVSNENELRRRLETKPWFIEMKDKEEKEKLLNKIPLKEGKHKQEVIEFFNGRCDTISIVESSNDLYRKEEEIYGKSSNIRR